MPGRSLHVFQQFWPVELHRATMTAAVSALSQFATALSSLGGHLPFVGRRRDAKFTSPADMVSTRETSPHLTAVLGALEDGSAAVYSGWATRKTY